MKRLVLLGEGHGEVSALPVLARKILREKDPAAARCRQNRTSNRPTSGSDWQGFLHLDAGLRSELSLVTSTLDIFPVGQLLSVLVGQTVGVMGLLLDLDFPVTTPGHERAAPARKRRRRIEADTPIVPCAVAVCVWEEACAWLEVELPRYWITRLAVRANVIYTHNPRFRRLLRGGGNAGRDWLWSFTRHWLAGLIRKHSRELHARLPAAYNVGQTLPPRLCQSTERFTNSAA